ncbi:uncharacterized protein N7529_005887 [Penicillium soppii]|jgi:hypothetical protein|uniref:uncharacterized protein n=1 Tax=Penicillium soppii TaxID=69789 RepID=UPI002546F35D|nr:uncharacterized protein N7529_005887 [Penicillium soppii]KAJ5863971.1 hypothetical protein N7529_005887 [Penicillium soppii]
MRFSTATIYSALVAMAAAYTTPDYSQNPTGNAIISPGLNEIVPEGKTYTIKWTPTTTGPISLVLLRGPSNNVQPLKTLAESIPNSGEFKWTPGSDLTPDTTHYGLLLVVEGTGQYQYSTQFGLSAAAGSSSAASTIEASETTAAHTATATTIETTESTTICPETETTAPAVSTSTPAWSTVISSSVVTTTICPETETASATSIPVVVPTGVTSKAWTSSAAASTVAASGTVSASPSASSPVFNGATSTKTISFGAVFAGLLVAFAI